MAVQSPHPPLPPGLHNRQPPLLPNHVEPSEGAGDGHISVDIPRIHPHPQACLHHDRVDPVAAIAEAFIGLADIVGALGPVQVVHMQVGVNLGNVEEVVDALAVLAVEIPLQVGLLTGGSGQLGSGPVDPLGPALFSGLVIIAGRVDVQNTRVGGVEFFIQVIPLLDALLRFEGQPAGALKKRVLFFTHKRMLVQKLVEVLTVALCRGLVALLGMRAGITHHDALELNRFFLRSGEFIELDDLVSEVRHVDASVRLAGDVKVVFLQVGELGEECQQSLEVVLGGVLVVVDSSLSLAEADASGGFYIEQVGLLVPSVGVQHQRRGIRLEHKGAILVDHPNETGAARAAIEPQNYRVVVGIILRVKVDIVVVTFGEVQISRVPLMRVIKMDVVSDYVFIRSSFGPDSQGYHQYQGQGCCGLPVALHLPV